MKKLLLIILSLGIILSLTSCIFNDVTELKDGYYYDFSDGIKTITNYHPYKIWALPDYQELVQFGEGAGLENEGRVYFIYIVDTSVDPNNLNAYYSAELDGETKELLCENGGYFKDEETKKSTVSKLIDIIDKVYLK